MTTCDACADRRRHTAAEWENFHELAGHGFAAGVWTHPKLKKEIDDMAYEAPAVGTVLPAKENTDVLNPGPVHDPYGNYEFLQADAQDKAFINNKSLKTNWTNAKSNSPEYAEKLGAEKSWAVLVRNAEAGGLYFDLQRLGPDVKTL